MADFTTEGVGEGVSSPFRPGEPVVDRSSAVAVDVIGKAINQVSQRKKDDPLVGVRDSFANDLSKLTARRDQGSLSQAAFATEVRTLRDQYAATGIPGVTEVLEDTIQQSSKTFGLGKLAQAQTAIEKQDEQDLTEAQSLQFDAPGLSEEQVLQNYRSVKRAQFDLANAQSQQTYDRGNLAFSQDIRKEKTQVATVNMAASYIPTLDSQIKNLAAEFEAGNISAEEAESMLNQFWASQSSGFRQAGSSFAGQDFMKGVTAPLDSMVEEALAYFNGSSTLERVNRANELAIAMTTKGWYADDRVRNMVVAQNIFRNSDILSFYSNTSSVVIEKLGGMMGAEGTDAPNLVSSNSDPSEINTTINLAKSTLKTAVERPEDNQLKVQGDNMIRNTLDSVSRDGDRAENAQSFQPALSFIASKEFGDYVSANGVPGDLAEEARLSIRLNYFPRLKKKVDSEFTDGYVRGFNPATQQAEQVNVKDVVTPVFNGIGVSFQLNRKAVPDFLNQAQQRSLNALVKNLNGKGGVAPAVNQLVKVFSNMRGDPSGYRQSYESLSEFFFEIEQEENNNDND